MKSESLIILPAIILQSLGMVSQNDGGQNDQHHCAWRGKRCRGGRLPDDPDGDGDDRTDVAAGGGSSAGVEVPPANGQIDQYGKHYVLRKAK